MDWTRSETLVLASNSCSYCRGLGMKGMLRGEDKPCECVFRSIFRACLRRFVLCATKEKNLSNVTYERHGAAGRGGSWGRKDEEYIADFLASAERTLEPLEQKVFRFYFLLGADWKLCARKLNMDRGTFFHAVYRIEKKLGKEFAEVQPYPLYPLREYFSSSSGQQEVHAFDPIPLAPKVRPIRPPLAKPPVTVEPFSLPKAA